MQEPITTLDQDRRPRWGRFVRASGASESPPGWAVSGLKGPWLSWLRRHVRRLLRAPRWGCRMPPWARVGTLMASRRPLGGWSRRWKTLVRAALALQAPGSPTRRAQSARAAQSGGIGAATSLGSSAPSVAPRKPHWQCFACSFGTDFTVCRKCAVVHGSCRPIRRAAPSRRPRRRGSICVGPELASGPKNRTSMLRRRPRLKVALSEERPLGRLACGGPTIVPGLRLLINMHPGRVWVHR